MLIRDPLLQWMLKLAVFLSAVCMMVAGLNYWTAAKNIYLTCFWHVDSSGMPPDQFRTMIGLLTVGALNNIIGLTLVWCVICRVRPDTHEPIDTHAASVRNNDDPYRPPASPMCGPGSDTSLPSGSE